MSLIPHEFTSAILTALGIGGAWLATWLGRRGKKEDVKIAERGQAFDQLLKLADGYLDEIKRLTTERDTANDTKETLRKSWEERWDRQMQRCRDITAPLVNTIKHLQESPASRMAEVAREADRVLRETAEHNERDHALDASEGPPEDVPS